MFKQLLIGGALCIAQGLFANQVFAADLVCYGWEMSSNNPGGLEKIVLKDDGRAHRMGDTTNFIYRIGFDPTSNTINGQILDKRGAADVSGAHIQVTVVDEKDLGPMLTLNSGADLGAVQGSLACRLK